MQNQYDDHNLVLDYNIELWNTYLEQTDERIKNCYKSERQKEELTQSLDLIRAINSYRSYNKPSLLLYVHPELIGQEEYIEILWKHFDSLSSEQLSDLAIEMIHEIDNDTEL